MLGGVKPRVPPGRGPSPVEIRDQLERILASASFARSERLSCFLRYVVEQTLGGTGDSLKEQVIAHDVYARPDSYDPNTDPIVRVDARRLRDKLREYYTEAEGERVLITLPKGSYVPLFEWHLTARPPAGSSAESVAPPVSPPSSRRRLIAAILLVVTLGAGTAWYAFRSRSRTTIRVRPLTSLPGAEGAPSLSPDGNFVVFAWKDGPDADLYIKEVDSESVRRLTDTPQREAWPAWSPDGRRIAFIRAGSGVFVTSPLGGAENRIAETGRRVAWSADSQSVFITDACTDTPEITCIYEVPTGTLIKRHIAKGLGVTDLAASPDGRTLAMVRGERPGVLDIYLLPLSGGEARRLTRQNRLIEGVAWTPDSKYLFYSMLEGARFRLWRIAGSDTGGTGEPVSALGESASMPSIAHATAGGILRVAYQSPLQDVSLRLVDLSSSSSSNPIGRMLPFADHSDGRDCGAYVSPDNGQVVFTSVRSGETRLWVANRDSSGLRPLTALHAPEIRAGGWSADGKRIVFDASVDGNSDIYITGASGGQPFRLTSEESFDALPAWSPDGRWIYFFSDRSGSAQIWKAPAAGGSAIQLTREGGFQPQPSFDGKHVYYLADFPGAQRPNLLKRIPEAGGEELVVLPDVSPFFWSVTSKGIHLLIRENGQDYLDQYDPSTGQRNRIGMLPFPAAHGFCGFISVSQDGRFLMTNHVDRFEPNLGLLEIPR